MVDDVCEICCIGCSREIRNQIFCILVKYPQKPQRKSKLNQFKALGLKIFKPLASHM